MVKFLSHRLKSRNYYSTSTTSCYTRWSASNSSCCRFCQLSVTAHLQFSSPPHLQQLFLTAQATFHTLSIARSQKLLSRIFQISEYLKWADCVFFLESQVSIWAIGQCSGIRNLWIGRSVFHRIVGMVHDIYAQIRHYGTRTNPGSSPGGINIWATDITGAQSAAFSVWGVTQSWFRLHGPSVLTPRSLSGIWDHLGDH